MHYKKYIFIFAFFCLSSCVSRKDNSSDEYSNYSNYSKYSNDVGYRDVEQNLPLQKLKFSEKYGAFVPNDYKTQDDSYAPQRNFNIQKKLNTQNLKNTQSLNSQYVQKFHAQKDCKFLKCPKCGHNLRNESVNLKNETVKFNPANSKRNANGKTDYNYEEKNYDYYQGQKFNSDRIIRNRHTAPKQVVNYQNKPVTKNYNKSGSLNAQYAANNAMNNNDDYAMNNDQINSDTMMKSRNNNDAIMKVRNNDAIGNFQYGNYSYKNVKSGTNNNVGINDGISDKNGKRRLKLPVKNGKVVKKFNDSDGAIEIQCSPGEKIISTKNAKVVHVQGIGNGKFTIVLQDNNGIVFSCENVCDVRVVQNDAVKPGDALGFAEKDKKRANIRVEVVKNEEYIDPEKYFL